MSRETTSEQSSVREGVSYDEVFQSGHEPQKGFSRLSERELSAHSPDDEVESQIGEEDEEVEGDDNDHEGREVEVEDDEGNGSGDKGAPEEGRSRSPGDGHTRPFILCKIWTMNDFYPTMMTKYITA